MAAGEKKITDLQLISSLTDTVNYVVDNGIQSYRSTALQIKNYILAAGNVTKAALAAGAIGRRIIETVSSSTTIGSTTDTCLGDTSGGAITTTLRAGASYGTGAILEFLKTSTDNTAWTIDGDGTEQINGATTTALHTEGEFLRIMWNGTAWIQLERRIPTKVVSWTPTGSWNTNVTFAGKKWRIGDRGFYEVKISCTGSPNAVLSTITQPSGETFDTAKMAHASSTNWAVMGIASADDIGGGYVAHVGYSSSTAIALYSPNSAGSWVTIGSLNNAQPFSFANGDSVTVKWDAPISGWNS